MPGPADATPIFEAQKRAPADLKAVVEFLRAKNGPKIRRGVLNGKRVDYFKGQPGPPFPFHLYQNITCPDADGGDSGKTAIRTLLGPAYQKLKKVPPITTEEEASGLLTKILPFAFFLRVDRPTPDPPHPAGSPKTLLLSPSQSFDSPSHFAWFYDGSPLYTILGGIAMVVIMLAGVMFPLWPIKLRLGVWYLSIAALCLIGAFMGLAVVRLVVWCGTVVGMKRAIWIFPNLFEDVGFVDSFIPTWAYDEPKKKKKRVGAKSSRDKPAKVDAENGGEAASAVPVVGASSATEENISMGGMKHRQAATVEEIDDEE